ncbi:MAG TPA: flagellar basal body rod protein FlgC [Candidatus Acidoferrum sp.]|nr:flagellar basal body rod protein FlgC [Candidatus Acidoferrum sp.]
MGGIFQAIEVSSRGLTVQRMKMNVVADNIANAETTETAEGGPYKRHRVLVKEIKEPGTFDSFLQQARTPLARTNENHIPGKQLTIRDQVPISDAQPKEVVDPASSAKLVYDPGNPNADEQGYVKMPDVEIINEMVDMMIASRAYEANTTAIASAKKMAGDALDIGK